MLAASRGAPQDQPQGAAQILEEYYEQQQRAFEAEQSTLQQIVQEQRLTTFGVVQSGQSVQKIERFTAIRFWAIAALVVGSLVYALTIYFSVRQKYAYMLAKVQAAIDEPDPAKRYRGSSAFFIALAYEYPFLASLRFVNHSFPAAVVFSYYTEQYSEIIAARPELVQAMLTWSTQNANANGQAIMCAVIGYPNNIPQCLPQCPGPVGSTWQAYLGSAIGVGGQGAFIGELAGDALFPGVGGIVGLGVGALLGGGLGAFLNWGNTQSARAQCGNNPKCATVGGGVRFCS